MLSYFRHNFFNYIKANIAAYFFVALIFIIGAIVGALAAKTLPEDQKKELISYLQIFFQGLSNSGLGNSANVFTNVILNNMKTIALIWVLGFTIVGIPFVLFIIFTRGFVIGFTVGFLVNEYVFKGLLFAFVSILPHNFLAIPAILIVGVSAVSFSLLLLKRKSRAKTNLLYESLGYTALCMGMLVVMGLASLVEVYISPVFMKMIAGLFLGQ